MMSEEEEMRNLLMQWSVPNDVQKNFIQHQIRPWHLSKLSENTLKELCPVLGLRIELKEKIQVYLDSISDTESITLNSDSIPKKTESTTIDPIDLDENNVLIDLTNYVPKPTLQDFDLKTLLLTSPCGNSVLNFYNSTGRLDNTRRNRLTDIIARHIFTHAVNYKITFDEYNYLAAKIITLFPTENIGTYFVRPISKSQSASGKSTFARGKLIDKVRNLLYKSDAHKRSTSKTFTVEREHNIQDYNDDDILWLRNNYDPWETVVDKWQKTYSVRQKDNFDDVASFVRAWPILNDPRSVELIYLDFDQMYPNRTEIFLSWKSFFQKVRVLKKDSLCEHGKILDEALTENNVNEDKYLPSEIILFAHLVPPKGRSGKKWKFSIYDAVEGLILHVKNPGDIDISIEKQRNKAFERNQHVQPYVLIQGESIYSINSIFIVVDNIKYSFESSVKAFDTLFKLYHVFHCKYPRASEHLYLLIQRCVYKIETKYDNISPFIVDLLNL